MHSRDRHDHHGNPTQIAKKDRANHSGNTVQRHVKFNFNFRMEVAGTDHNSPVGSHRTFMTHEFLTFIVNCDIPLQRSFKAYM